MGANQALCLHFAEELLSCGRARSDNSGRRSLIVKRGLKVIEQAASRHQGENTRLDRGNTVERVPMHFIPRCRIWKT